MVEIVKCSKMQAWIQRACLGAQRTQSTKSRGPKDLNLEFGAQRAQRFLVFNMGLNWVNSTFPLCFTWKSYILHWRADGRLAPGQSPSGHSACQTFSRGHSAWQTFSRGQSACQTFSRGHSACLFVCLGVCFYCLYCTCDCLIARLLICLFGCLFPLMNCTSVCLVVWLYICLFGAYLHSCVFA